MSSVDSRACSSGCASRWTSFSGARLPSTIRANAEDARPFPRHIELILDPVTGKSRCTACKLCERACPSSCILVEGAKLEGAKTKSVTDYHLNFTTCSLCGSCIEAARSDAIQFSKVVQRRGTSRNDFDNMDLVKQLAEKRQEVGPRRPRRRCRRMLKSQISDLKSVASPTPPTRRSRNPHERPRRRLPFCRLSDRRDFVFSSRPPWAER